MSTFRMLPLALGLAMAAPLAHAADLLSIARDALENNASLQGSRAGVNATHEGEAGARSALLPQLNATAGMTRYDNHNSEYTTASASSSSAAQKRYTSTSSSVTLTQSLFDASSWYALKEAKRTTEQARLQLASTEQTLLYNVANAYFTVLKAHDVLNTYRAEEEAYARQLDQVRQQFRVGVVAATDVREAEASFDSAQAQRIAQESTLQVAFEALEQLTGKQYATLDGLDNAMPIEAPVPARRDAWIDMATTGNLAVQAARAGIDVARETVKGARSGHLPTLSANASYRYGDSNRDAFHGYDEGGSVGLTASLPIYSGGKTSAAVRKATYSLEQTQFNAEESLRNAIQSVNSYYAQSSNDVYTIRARQRAITSSRASLEATRNGYEAGTRTILDVLNAQQTYYSAMASYAESRYDYVLHLLALRQNAGILDVNALTALNQWLRSERAVHIDGVDSRVVGSATGARS